MVSPYLRTHCSSQQLRGLIKSLEMSLTLPFTFVLWPSLRDSRRELGQGFATLFCFVLKRNYIFFVVTNVVVKHNMFFILKMDGGRELERDWCLVRFAYFRKMVYICMLSLLKGCIHTELLRFERRWRGPWNESKSRVKPFSPSCHRKFMVGAGGAGSCGETKAKTLLYAKCLKLLC